MAFWIELVKCWSVTFWKSRNTSENNITFVFSLTNVIWTVNNEFYFNETFQYIDEYYVLEYYVQWVTLRFTGICNCMYNCLLDSSDRFCNELKHFLLSIQNTNFCVIVLLWSRYLWQNFLNVYPVVFTNSAINLQSLK